MSDINDDTFEQLEGSILLVDDEKDLVLLMGELLRYFGLEVDTATNGEEALALYNANPDKYDILVTDIKMPVMSGIKLLDAIDEHPSETKPRYILLTGSVDIDLRQYSERCEGFFGKPYSEEKVFKLLKKTLFLGRNQRASHLLK